MKTHTSISHFTGKEKNALLCIRKKIVEELQPLVIFCFGSRAVQSLTRSYFTSKRQRDDWAFTCDLLVVLPADTAMNKETGLMLKELTAPLGKVNMLVHPLNYFNQALKSGNFFFSWIQRTALILYEKDKSELLFPPVLNKTDCYKNYPKSYQCYTSALEAAGRHEETAKSHMITESYPAVLTEIQAVVQHSLEALVMAAIGYKGEPDDLPMLLEVVKHHAEVVLPEDITAFYFPAFLDNLPVGEPVNVSHEQMERLLNRASTIKTCAANFYTDNPALLAYAKEVVLDKPTASTTAQTEKRRVAWPLSTSPYQIKLSRQEIANPYQVASSFFYEFDFEGAKDTIRTWMDAVCEAHVWEKEPPGCLLYFYEHLIRLLEACWLIQQRDNTHRLANISERGYTGAELLNPDLFCRSIFKDFSWDFFPRSLSTDDYQNPYKVFNQLFAYRSLQEWKKALHSALHIALSTDIMEPLSGEEINILNYKKYLEQVVDACHLIHIREFQQVEDTLSAENHSRSDVETPESETV